MSFDAIEKIKNAEEESKNLVAKAHMQARQMIADAEGQGKQKIADAIESAKKEREELLGKVLSQIESSDVESKSKTDSEVEALKKSSIAKVDDAAKLIVERIVEA